MMLVDAMSMYGTVLHMADVYVCQFKRKIIDFITENSQKKYIK